MTECVKHVKTDLSWNSWIFYWKELVKHLGFSCKAIALRETAPFSENKTEVTILVAGEWRGRAERRGCGDSSQMPSQPDLVLCCPSVLVLWHCRTVPTLTQAPGSVGSWSLPGSGALTRIPLCSMRRRFAFHISPPPAPPPKKSHTPQGAQWPNRDH